MTPQPDFLRPVGRPHPLAWLACATAFAVLGIAVLDAAQAWQQQQTPAELPTARAKPVAPIRDDGEAQRALLQAVARLDRPWAATFAALDSITTPGVAWLALEAGDNGQLRLQGQAPDARSAMAAAEALRRQAPWQQALLGRMEAASGAALRFEISAEATR